MSKSTTAADPSDEDVLLPGEVAAILRVPVATLNAWRGRRRVDGTRPGPKFIRIEGGRVRYLRGEVRAYLAEREGARRATR
jgi:hypothetical protein